MRPLRFASFIALCPPRISCTVRATMTLWLRLKPDSEFVLFTLALTCVLSPGERILPILLSVIRLTVRPIPTRVFPRSGARESPLLGERVG